MNQNQNHINGSRASAAKALFVLLLSLVATTLVAQEASLPLLERLNGTTWRWSPANIGGTTTTTVTFKGTTLEYSWGGNGTLTSTSDPLTITLKTTDGIILDMVFDPFTSGFDVKNGPRLIARGRKSNQQVAAVNPPSSASVESGSTVSAGVGLQLGKGWDTPLQGGTATMDDLSRLFGSLAKPKVDLSEAKGLPIYEGIMYLMPVRQAIDSLKLSLRLPSKVLIACPGFPRDSFYYYAVDGRFDGHFNRLYLVVDKADQVVSVELVDESPKNTMNLSRREQGWHTYNFVSTRTKATNMLEIDHHVLLSGSGRFESTQSYFDPIPKISRQNENWTLARVDSALVQLDRKYLPRQSDLVVKEQVRWYVPRPIVELILTCVQKGGK